MADVPATRTAAAVGKRLYRVRKALGFSQAEFSRGLCTQQAYAQYELGTRLISPIVAGRFRDAHGISLDYIYLGVEAGVLFSVIEAMRKLGNNR